MAHEVKAAYFEDWNVLVLSYLRLTLASLPPGSGISCSAGHSHSWKCGQWGSCRGEASPLTWFPRACILQHCENVALPVLDENIFLLRLWFKKMERTFMAPLPSLIQHLDLGTNPLFEGPSRNSSLNVYTLTMGTSLLTMVNNDLYYRVTSQTS